jgi:hypothetical protein
VRRLAQRVPVGRGLVLAAALLLSACGSKTGLQCGPGTTEQGGYCVAEQSDGGGGDAVDAASEDGPAAVVRAARWTNAHMNKPESLAAIANLNLPPLLAEGGMVMLFTVRPGELGPELHGGIGARQSSDAGVAYSLTDDLQTNGQAGAPIWAAPATLDGGATTLFGTPATVDVRGSFQFTPDQPPLDVRWLSISGTLDAEGLPTSASPALSGRYTGCFTQASAHAICPTIPGIPCTPLDEALGAPDCSASGSGTLDGYFLDLDWEASEIVELQ